MPIEATDLFLALTPERVLAAVEAGGLRTRPLAYPLNSFENRVYEVELEDRSRVIAKFYRPGRWSAAQIEEEHAFLRELAEDELPVVEARQFPGGGTLRQTEGILYALFDRRGGRAPDELDESALRRLGRLVGRLHAVGARHEAPHRMRLTSEDYARRDLAWLEEHTTVPERLRTRYFRAARAICDAYDERLEGVRMQRLHGDLHLGNLLLRDDQLLLVDFDDMMTGPAVQDLWLARARARRAPRSPTARFSCSRATRQMRDSTELRCAWSSRCADCASSTTPPGSPAAGTTRSFPPPFPHFGTEEYWREQTEDLEQQGIAIERGWGAEDGAHRARAPEDQAAAEDSELTNKDFFWDWEG